MPEIPENVLKHDLFGRVLLVMVDGEQRIRRDISDASPWIRWLARALMRREAKALAALDGLPQLPQLLRIEHNLLERSFVDGLPMQKARPTEQQYFKASAKLLRQLHRAGIAHNDLAKEPNLLVTPDGAPAFIDFQLASVSRTRGRWFRILAHEDIRHLLKHKRTYCREHLTTRELAILANPSPVSRIWMATVKPVYLFVTRRLLGWADREGAGDRGAAN